MTPAERFHTKQRLAERYGLVASSAEIHHMAKRIAHGQACFLARQSRHVAQWQLTHRGVAIRFVFDSRRRSILTALPPHDSAHYLVAKYGGDDAGIPHFSPPTAVAEAITPAVAVQEARPKPNHLG